LSLASDKYLRRVPLDPITESDKTWVIVQPQDAQKGGVYDIRSGAQGSTKDGKAFSDL
jgi:general secretion pathway protein G